MGSIAGGLMGGSKGSSSSQSGFALLPKEIQDFWKGFATQGTAQLPNLGQAYTPMPQTADESRAFDILRTGFTPTEESLHRDIGMLMNNPFDEFVTNDINRQANSDYSILKQDMSNAGTFGSNRQRLGANDIENTRLGTIGKMRQGQYNTAIDQIFNGLLPARAADATGLMSIGGFQRGLAGETAQAPIIGLQNLAQAMGILPKDGGSQSSSKSSSSGGMGNLISGIGDLFG